MMRVMPRLLRLLAACAIAAAAVAPSAAPAGSADDRTRRIAELETMLGELSADEAAALRELEAVQARRAELDARIAALDGEIAAAQAALDAATRDVERLTAQYLALDAELDETEARLREARTRFAATAVALYETGTSVGQAAGLLIFETDDPLVVSIGAEYLRGISGDRRAAVEELTRLEEAIAELVVTSEEHRVAATRALAEAEEQRDLLASLRAEQESARSEVAAQERREADLLAEIRARQADYEAELAALTVTSNAIGDLLLTRQRDQERAADFSVVRPVPGAITSGFGLRLHPILGTSRMHNGVDMHADYGTTVSAGSSGVVVWSGPRDGYGNTVIIDHGNQYATLYAHLSALWVGPGDTVGAGDGVGAVGATGLATGPHLHFEVRLLGVPMNPVPYM
jgi:murein DD-endopeptidase MepM/ murein hydrolase activator NlpD